MSIYIILLLLTAAAWFIDQKTAKNPNHKKIHISMVIILALCYITVSSLRYSIGFDYFSYKDLFEQTANQSFSQMIKLNWKEPAYYFFSWIFSRISNNYQIWLFVVSAFMTGSVFYIVDKNTESPWISYMLYILLHIFGLNMNLLRQSIAAIVLLWGYKYLVKGDTIKFIIVTIIASTFHITSLVAIPAYFIIKLPFNKKWCIGTSIVAVISIFTFKPLLTSFIELTKYSSYLHSSSGVDYFAPGALSMMLMEAAILIVPFIFSYKLYTDDKNNSIVFYTSLITATTILMGANAFIMERFSIFFYPYVLIFIPQILSQYKPIDDEIIAKNKNSYEKNSIKNKNIAIKENRNVIIFAVMVIAVLNFAYGAKCGYHKAYPYVSIFNQEAAVDNNSYLANR